MQIGRGAPTRFGRYWLFDAFARGGMASVHFARVERDFGLSRVVAVKRHHPHLVRSREFVTMITSEGLIAGRLQHPNVVPTLDIVARDGELLLVMEYVGGLSLADLMLLAGGRGERIPIAITLAVMIDVLRGLDAAHRATDEYGEPLGIVHCDVSPQNVLIGADGMSRITDFGIATARGRAQLSTEQLKGKLEYMAVEQLKRERIDARTDVYAASVVLWEALTGKRLFAADDPGVVFARVVRAEVRPPSAELPEIPPAFDEILLRGLSSEPERRFESAAAFADALARAAPVATRAEVSAWLFAVAGDELEQRAQRVREIERWFDPRADALLVVEAPTQRRRAVPSSRPPPPMSLASPHSVPWLQSAPSPFAQTLPSQRARRSGLVATDRFRTALSMPVRGREIALILTFGILLNLLALGGLLSHASTKRVPDEPDVVAI